MKKQTYFEKYLDIAPFALALWRAVEARELELVRKKFNCHRPVLDVGCGFGEFAGVFFNRAIEVGIDISPTDLLQAAQGKTYKNLFVEDARKLSFPNHKFATAISISVLEHIPQVELAIKEIYRVLKPKGYLIATIPTNKLYSCLFYPRLLEKIGLKRLGHWYYRLYNKSFKHVNLWPESKWKKIFQESKFKIVYSRQIISPLVTKIFDLFLITALPSQIGRWLFGNRVIWGLSWKKWLLTKIFSHLITQPTNAGSNIIIVLQK